jgi:hypothetical protein
MPPFIFRQPHFFRWPDAQSRAMHAALPPAALLRANLTPINVGIGSGLELKTFYGLAENAQVAVYSDTKLLDNMRAHTLTQPFTI